MTTTAVDTVSKPPDALAAYLASLRRIASADAVQIVRYAPTADLVADCSPSPEVSANLLAAAAAVPDTANGARTVVNTYRFGDRIVHLVASDCGNSEWLLVWFRLPEGASADGMAALVELAAQGRAGQIQSAPSLPKIPDVLDSIDFTATRARRLRQFCQWMARKEGIAQALLARKDLTGWKVCAASGQLPTRSGPLAHAIVHALRGQSGESAIEEIQRLTGQPAARVFVMGQNHAVIVAGTDLEISADILETGARLLPLLDPHVTPLHTLAQHWRESPSTRRKLWIGGTIFAAILLFLPVHQRVRSDVILEPTVRRFIAAPFNGVVKKVHARAGDIVEPGQLLVELDGREITERLADVEARLSSAILQNTTELEDSNYSQAAVRALDAEGLSHERDLLKHQQENLKLYSPIRGVIVTGELERSEGAAVELGKPLLELAPLDQMLAEIAVDETDVALVRDDMKVSLTLNALPGRTFHSDVLKVSPRSETRDGRNVFITEAELPNAEGVLRPGMKGHSVIYASRRPLGWTLIRKPWQMMQRWLFR